MKKIRNNLYKQLCTQRTEISPSSRLTFGIFKQENLGDT